MKKILAILFIVILMLTTVGCGSKNNSNDYEDSNYSEELDELKDELEDLLMSATQSTVEKAFGSPIEVDGNTYFYMVPNHRLMAVITYTFDGYNKVVNTVWFAEP